MSNTYNIRVTKCYLVEVVDEEGNSINSEYVFTDNIKQAKEIGKQLKTEIIQE